MHPSELVYLEHDGKLLLVDLQGKGPQLPTPGRATGEVLFRFPSVSEVEALGIQYERKDLIRLRFNDETHQIIKGYPCIDRPKDWAWKDACIADNAVHPVVREAVYRSIHRVVAKVMVQNESGDVLMGKVERGHFKGFWTLPGGYLDHNEHPAIGCVRETMEELGLKIVLDNHEPVITQRVFNDEGISFISLTYRSTWNGSLDELTLQTEEIAEAKWFSPDDAVEQAVSHFDQEALRSLLSS